MVIANFKDTKYVQVHGLYQWDYGQKLLISGLDLEGKNVEIHFAEECSDVALRELGTVENGVISVDIPDVLLQTGSNIMAYVFLSTENEGETIATVRLHVKPRQKPEDYETPEAESILQKILAIAQSVRDDADNGKFDGKPGAPGVDGYSPSILLTETAEGVQITVQNKDSESTVLVKNGKDGLPGESAYKIAVRLGFKGTEQEWVESLKGEQGEPGAAPHIGENGNWYIGEEDTGKPSRGGRGDPGEKGDPGKSAYEYAVDGGYKGSEEEFAGKLSEDYAPAIIESASGESILVEDSANRRLRGFNLYGKSSQVTTTGAQLLDVGEVGKVISSRDGTAVATVTENGVEIEFKDATNTATSDIYFKGKQESVEESSYEDAGLTAGTYKIKNESTNVLFFVTAWRNNSNVTLVSSNGNTTQFEVKEGDKFQIFFRPKSKPLTKTLLEKPMITRIGDENKPYEPYTGGKPSPSIEYPQEIENAGENGQVGVEVGNGGYVQKGTYFDNLRTLPLIKGMTYHAECKKKLGNIVNAYVFSKDDIGNVKTSSDLYSYGYRNGFVESNSTGIVDGECKLPSNMADTGYTFTVTVDGLYLYQAINKAENNTDDYYIGYHPGIVDTPYKSQSLTIPTPNGLPGIPVASNGNYTDENGQQWITDEIDFARGKYVQRIGVHDLKNIKWNDAWNKSEVYHKEGTFLVYTGHFNETATGSRLISTHFVVLNNILGTPDIGMKPNEGAKYNLAFRIPTSIANSIEEWEDFINNNNIEVFYVLETPIEHDLPPEVIEAYKQLQTNYPTTTVLNDAGARMRMEYVADTKLYIDKLFAENQKSITNTNKQLLERM